MASTFISVPAFPNVPALLGVPPIPRDPNAILSSSVSQAALTEDGMSINDASSSPQWGIYTQDGDPVLTGDTTFSFQYGREYKVSDYPVEQGAFASYNKVQLPFVGRMTLLKGGPISDKADFLNACEDICGDLTLYQIVTPEVNYDSVNITHYDYDRRAAKGVGLMYVEIWIEEIRVAPPAAFTKVATPSASDPANTGTVQAQPLTSSDKSLASQKIADGG